MPNAIRTTRDTLLGMARSEEFCRRCGGHLATSSMDGPKPRASATAINGLALTFNRPSSSSKLHRASSSEISRVLATGLRRRSRGVPL